MLQAWRAAIKGPIKRLLNLIATAVVNLPACQAPPLSWTGEQEHSKINVSPIKKFSHSNGMIISIKF